MKHLARVSLVVCLIVGITQCNKAQAGELSETGFLLLGVLAPIIEHPIAALGVLCIIVFGIADWRKRKNKRS